jgi:Icc-related predicted phosphoesterase
VLADAGPVGAVLLGGDLTTFGAPADAARLVRAAESAGAPVLAVAGNCDSAEIDAELAALGVGLHAQGVTIDGVGFHGLSGIPPWRSAMYQFSEAELAEALAAGHAQVVAASRRILLAHVPPQGCRADRTHFFQHVGSTAVREFLDRAQPALAFCGHVHEAHGVEQLGETIVVNCGAGTSGHYALAEIGPNLRVDHRRA